MDNKITFVNINDIEDLIIAKIQIDKDDPNITDRSDLTEFIKKYCTLNCILTNNEISIPFNIINIFFKRYLFYSSNSKETTKVLIDTLKKIDYDISKLKPKAYTDLLTNPIYEDKTKYYIMHDNNVYFV